MTVLDIQRRLRALGYAIGTSGPANDGVDGDFGRRSQIATLAALGVGERAHPTPQPSVLGETRPAAGEALVSTLLARQAKTGRAISEVIVHCTATPEGRAVSVETIRGWHKAQGWKDIGYHYVVLLDGTVEAGRPEAQIGSHVRGRNTGTLGVVYVGGLAADGKTPKDTRSPGQMAALLTVVAAMIAKYPAVTRVSGHNQYAAKACPSFDVRKDALGALVESPAIGGVRR